MSTEQINQAIENAEPVQPADTRIELTSCNMTPKEALLELCGEAEFWRTPDGTVYATLHIDGHQERHAVASRDFRDWLLSQLARRFTNKGRAASANEAAVREARHYAEAEAFLKNCVQEAELRVMGGENAVFMDRGGRDWSAFQVTAQGWSVVAIPPVPILRSRRTAAMVEPSAPGDFAALRHMLRNLDDDAFILVVAWCLGALAARGPFAVLVLIGEGGVGKSTLVRVIQSLVDPCTGDVLAPPREDRDLIAAAKHARLLPFDNLSSISPELGDSICRLATGAEIGGRALYSNHDSASFAACRPIVLNGIADLASRSDLLDRSLVIRLQPLESWITESDMEEAIAQALPHVLHGLLDALACGLRNLKSTPTPDVRMADFARLVVAAEPMLPWRQGAFLGAFRRNRRQALAALVDGDVVGQAIKAFAHRHPAGWSGMVSQLLEQLSRTVPEHVRRTREWPGNARWLTDRIRRVAPGLRSLGIPITTGGRSAAGAEVTIGPLAASATSATSDADADDASVASDAGGGPSATPSGLNGLRSH